MKQRVLGQRGAWPQIAATSLGCRHFAWQCESLGQRLSLQSSISSRSLPNLASVSHGSHCSCTPAAPCGDPTQCPGPRKYVTRFLGHPPCDTSISAVTNPPPLLLIRSVFCGFVPSRSPLITNGIALGGPFSPFDVTYRRLLLHIGPLCYVSGHICIRPQVAIHCKARHPVMQRFCAHATIALIATKPRTGNYQPQGR